MGIQGLLFRRSWLSPLGRWQRPLTPALSQRERGQVGVGEKIGSQPDTSQYQEKRQTSAWQKTAPSPSGRGLG
ncbi:hypothetical protein BWR15_21565 [Pseudomonas sp. T]|nr:hypothetical protein BWR15_21565 [Pseudomonas sp. T]